jgi:hypothetical protein
MLGALDVLGSGALAGWVALGADVLSGGTLGSGVRRGEPGVDGAGPWITSSLFRTIALKVPVAAVHSGFGGGSTNTWLTSASGLNSNASSGMASSSSKSNGGGGGVTRAGGGGAAGGVGAVCCVRVGAVDGCCGRGGAPADCWGRAGGGVGGVAGRDVLVCCGARAVGAGASGGRVKVNDDDGAAAGGRAAVGDG